MNISHQGIGTNNAVTYALDQSLRVPIHSQGTFEHFEKIVTTGTAPGTVVLGGAYYFLGVIVDLSPRGDSVSVEMSGYNWVKGITQGVNYGDLVTCVPGGTLAPIATPGYPSEDEKRHGCWRVDQVGDGKLLIVIDRYL